MREHELPNYTLQFMKENGIPLTRENYLDIEYMGNPPHELDGEIEAELPRIFQQHYLDLTTDDTAMLAAMGISDDD